MVISYNNKAIGSSAGFLILINPGYHYVERLSLIAIALLVIDLLIRDNENRIPQNNQSRIGMASTGE
jgi:hypothetical protein